MAGGQALASAARGEDEKARAQLIGGVLRVLLLAQL